MSDDKKEKTELTRIEDLDDFIHEDEDTETITSQLEDIEESNTKGSADSSNLKEQMDAPTEDFPMEEVIEEAQIEPNEEKKKEVGEQVEHATSPKFEQPLPMTEMKGNAKPPYSLVIKEITYQEEVEDIMALLRDYKLIKEEKEQKTRQMLGNGSLILSHLSEYVAIHLSLKLRKFSLQVEVKLSDTNKKNSETYEEIPSQGQIEEGNTEFVDINQEKTILATTETSPKGMSITKRWGIAVVSKIIEQQKEIKEKTYEELEDMLKERAKKWGGNAIIGIQFETNPLSPPNPQGSIKSIYQIVGSGNVVTMETDLSQ